VWKDGEGGLYIFLMFDTLLMLVGCKKTLKRMPQKHRNNYLFKKNDKKNCLLFVDVLQYCTVFLHTQCGGEM
jgi:hypothetical protein